jgi:hypothetical protein
LYRNARNDVAIPSRNRSANASQPATPFPKLWPCECADEQRKDVPKLDEWRARINPRLKRPSLRE